MSLVGSVRENFLKPAMLVLFAFAGVVFAVNIAVAQDVFAVQGIEVDETAGNDADAKKQGVAVGKRVAFARLMARLLVPEDLGRVPEISDERLEFMLRDVAIEEEKFGGGRYLGTLSVRFGPDAVREFLRRAKLAFAETPSRPMVVLPIARGPSGDVLFQDTNPWLDAWASLPPRDGLVRFIPPLGDLADMAAVDAARAVAGDIPSLSAIARRYDVGAVLVAILTLRLGTDDVEQATVTLTAYGPGWDGRSFSGEYSDIPPVSETPDAFEASEDLTPRQKFLIRTAGNVADALELAWKRENLLRFDLGSQSLSVVAPISGLSDWLLVRQGLMSAAPISDVTLSSLALDEAKAEITFVGQPDRLATALAQKGLAFAPSEDGAYWTVTRTR